MPYEFKLPEAAEEVDEGIVVAWFKREGAAVVEGEPLLEVQFAKVSSEVTAPISGRLFRILAPRDAVITPGQVLALILQPGEDAPGQQPQAALPAQAAPAETPGFVPASPAARRLAKERGVDLAKVQGTGAEGRITEEDVQRYPCGAGASRRRRARCGPHPSPSASRRNTASTWQPCAVRALTAASRSKTCALR